MNASIASMALLASLLCAGNVYGAPHGELDDTFGEHGRMMIHTANLALGSAITQQPADGKLLLPGQNNHGDGGSDFAVLRLNPDGSRDSAFGTNGLAIVEFSGLQAGAAELAVQSDGRIIVVGWAAAGETNLDLALARVNADGTIDPTFGNNGRVTVDLGGDNEFISDIVSLQSGKFVVVGSTDANGDQDAVFARFGTGGALDTTFGTGSIAGTTIVGVKRRTDELFSMIRQPDGKFVACGAASDYSELVYIGGMLAIRVNADGAVDSAFGTDGVSLVDEGLSFSAAYDCAAMPDGKLVLAGFNGYPGMVDPTLVRLMPDGSRDTTFGSAGSSRFAVAHIASARSIVLLDDGSLGVSGFAVPLHNTTLPTDMFFARIDADSGSLDSTFGNHGVTTVDFGQASEPSLVQGRGLIAQADGKLVAVGQDFHSNLQLARADLYGSGSEGVAGFLATSATLSTKTANFVVSVRRTGGSTGNLAVDYNTIADAATAPGGFATTSGTLTWGSGEMDPKSITIPIKAAGRFSIVLSNSTGGLAASEFDVQVTQDVAHDGGAGAGAGAGAGGGGATGIAELWALALILAFATQRRRRATRR